jgi:hypothetical protein
VIDDKKRKENPIHLETSEV